MSVSLKAIALEFKTDLVGAQPAHQIPDEVLSLHKCNLPERLETLGEQFIPRLKNTMENSWEYSVMGIQTVSLSDPVFTRRGDLICELALVKGVFSY